MKFEESEWTDNFEEYREKASLYMKKYYYITWDEAAGDPEPILSAIESRETPTEFIDRIANKYNLKSIFDDDGLGPLALARHLKFNGIAVDG